MHCSGVSTVDIEQVNTDRVGFKLCYQIERLLAVKASVLVPAIQR